MLAIDYSWTHPDPGAIKRAGYSGVLRYLSPDKTKNATIAEVESLHRAGLWVGLVWEGAPSRAAHGELAGRADCRTAEKQASRLGYPEACPIFYAVDFDGTPLEVRPYFTGVTHRHTHPVGVYGSLRVVESLVKNGVVGYGWQTVAWSGGGLSPHAHLYQRARPTHPVTGAQGAYDEDVVMHPFPVWSPAVKPHPTTTPTPTPAPDNPDHDLLVAFQKWSHEKGLTG